jgi:FkbM family methyltransferase
MLLFEKIKLWHRAYKYRLADDRGEISYLLHAIHKGDTVIDIGAHKAGYTYWMQKAVGENGKVIAFEPQQKGFAYLLQLKKMQNWENVSIENLALSDHEGEETLYIRQQSYDISFEASLEKKYAAGFTEQKINTTTIDIYCADHLLQPRFIKIDVEGHEWQVLKGAKTILNKFHPTLLLECEVRHAGAEAMNNSFSTLLSMDYKGFFIHGKKLLPLHEFSPEKYQKETPVTSKNKNNYCNNFVFK